MADSNVSGSSIAVNIVYLQSTVSTIGSMQINLFASHFVYNP